MLILKNVTAVQLHPAKVQEGVDIAIENDVIVAIGDALTQRYPDASFKEMHGRIVMPGIVCSHNHFYSGLSRGIMANIAPCPDFISTLKNLWWRLDRALDEESLYYSGLICSLEAIKSGCTSVIDHHASPAYIGGSLSTLRDAFLKVGLRAMTCFETTDRNNGIKELQEGVEENIRFARLIDEAKKATSEPYLVEAHIGAHAPFTVPDAGLEMLREAVKATGRGLHIHAAEDLYDVSYSHHWYGKDLLARLAQFDLIDSKTLVAHGLYLSKDDIALLNQRDAFLVHNARSNMNNHVGYNHHLSDIRNLALGTDGIGSDMFEEMKFAFFKHRDAGGPLWPDSFAKALTNGNELMSRNFGAKFGLLEAGYKADLTICDYNSPTPLLAENIAGHIAFGMGSGSVHSVMVNGVMVYEDRQFNFDCDSIYAQARKAATRMKPSGSPGAANSMLHQPVPIKRLPFPYRIWNWTGLTGITVHCGLAQCLACSHCVMRDLFLQRCVKPSVLFTHAMFVISRPLVVKSPPARKSRCCFPSCWHWMLNWFLATAKRCQSRTTWPAHAIAC